MPPHADVLQWEHLPFPRSLPQFQRLFPDDDTCARARQRAHQGQQTGEGKRAMQKQKPSARQR